MSLAAHAPERAATEGYLTGKALLIGAAAAAAIIAAGSANAQYVQQPLTYGSGWQEFGWSNGVGSVWTDGSFGPYVEYTFTISGPSPEDLQVADGYNAGDEFAFLLTDLSTNTVQAYFTSPSAYNPDVYNPLYYIGNNYSAAFYPDEAPYFSHLSLTLGDGSYSLIGIVTQTTQTEFGIFSCCGTGGIQLTYVPEPADWALMLLGFGVVGAAVRHRQKAPAKA